MIKRKAVNSVFNFHVLAKGRTAAHCGTTEEMSHSPTAGRDGETESVCRHKGLPASKLLRLLLSSGFPSYIWSFLCNLQVFYLLTSHKTHYSYCFTSKEEHTANNIANSSSTTNDLSILPSVRIGASSSVKQARSELSVQTGFFIHRLLVKYIHEKCKFMFNIIFMQLVSCTAAYLN